MKVGVSFTLDTTSRDVRATQRLYSFMLEVAEEADHLGLDHLWYSEHHLWRGSHLTQPLAFCAAVAARTTKVRIGSAVTIAPFRSAAEIAEQAVLADLISDGRFELGIGAGYRVPEYGLFGGSLTSRYDDTDQRAREVRRLLDGIVTPRAVQPRLPMWLGYQGPKGARRAGLLGEGLLSASPSSWDAYREGLLDGGHDLETTGRMAGALEGWITSDIDRDWPVISRHAALKYDSFRRHMVDGTDRPEPRPVDLDRLRAADLGSPMRYFLYATPEVAAARIRQHLAKVPVHEVHIEAPLTDLDESFVVRFVQTVATQLRPLLVETTA